VTSRFRVALVTFVPGSGSGPVKSAWNQRGVTVSKPAVHEPVVTLSESPTTARGCVRFAAAPPAEASYMAATVVDRVPAGAR
jgi:hypothetical protein